MTPARPRGTVYRCPRCGAEVVVLARRHGDFCPRCCNTDMRPKPARAQMYVCPRCGSEIAVVGGACGVFRPRCCNGDMVREAA